MTGVIIFGIAADQRLFVLVSEGEVTPHICVRMVVAELRDRRLCPAASSKFSALGLCGGLVFAVNYDDVQALGAGLTSRSSVAAGRCRQPRRSAARGRSVPR